MKTIFHLKLLATITLSLFFSNACLYAQLDKVFEDVFIDILGSKERDGALAYVSPPNGTPDQNHANHFIPASEAANSVLVPALNRLIASNVSSFPLSSTSAGIRSFDFSTGQPVAVRGSLGPIFAETGRTLGKKKLHTGMNYNYLDLAKVRGVRTEDIKFTFAHVDVEPVEELGNSAQESDLIDIILDLDVNANIFAFYATYGLFKHLDVSVALPVMNISMEGNAKAIIDSYTFARLGFALHHFDKDAPRPVSIDPVLEYTQPYSESAFGIGDLALRLKYSFLNKRGGDLAALVDVRLPTGDKHNFFGTGAVNARFLGIASKQFGDFTPHINVGYEYRGAEFDSDEFEIIAGFDQKIAKGLTFALDFLGQIDLNTAETLTFEYADPIVIVDQIQDTAGTVIGRRERDIKQTNIPTRLNDNVFSTAIGFRYAPADNAILLANILVPLNDGGLRSDIAYTVGFSFNF